MTGLAAQTDYLLFVAGLCFVSLAASAVLLRLQGNESLRWNLLAVYGGLSGAALWLALLTETGLATQWLSWSSLLIRLAAYTAALEFGRRALRQIDARVPRVWWIALPVACSVAAIPFGLRAATLATHTLLGLPGTLLGGAALWVVSATATPGARRSLRLAAVTLPIGGVLSLVVAITGGAGTAESAQWQLVQAITLALASTALLHYSAQFASKVHSEERPLAVRRLIIVPLVAAVAIGGWFITDSVGRSSQDAERSALEKRAATAAAALGGSGAGELEGSAADVSQPAYAATLGMLAHMQRVNPDIQAIYMMRLIDGHVVFLADASDDPASPGDLYLEASPALRRALRDHLALTEGPLADRWGTWVSAFAPVTNGTTGEFLGLVGLDVNAIEWEHIVATGRLLPIGATGLLTILLLGFYGLGQLGEHAAAIASASERRLQTVIRRAPEGIVVVDKATGLITSANQRAADLLGMSRDDIRGAPFGDLLEPESPLTAGVTAIEACGTDGRQTEWRLPTASEREASIELTCTEIEDAGVKVMAFMHDITARKHAEEELHERINLENLIRAISSGFISAEASEVDTRADEALGLFGDFFGVERAYLFALSADGSRIACTHEWVAAGTTPLRLSMQDVDASSYPWLMEHLLRNDFVHVPDVGHLPDEASAERELFQVRNVRSCLLVPMISGTQVTGFLGFEALSHRTEWSGERIALVSVMADILANALRRARAEAELAKLSMAVTRSPAATVITDDTGRIEFVNPRFQELSGYSAEELLGQNPRRLKSGMLPQSVYEELWRTISTGGQWRGELVNQAKDGHLYWVQASISPIRDEFGAVNYVGVQEDITAIKEAEQELKSAMALAQEANRAKSDFLATMSHEIRTPMNAIIGMAELLEETKLDDEQSRYVRVFRSAGEALLTLINDILDLSKVEAGRLELDVREFDIERLVEDTAEVLAVRAREKGLQLLVRVGGDVPGLVMGDPDRLRQILVNLTGNAVKFTGEGEVIVSVRIEDPARPDRITFEVIDSGIGIEPDKLASVFEAFTQADSSTTRKYGGTGLGLTISRRLAALMEGELGVTSEPGKGSTFFFTATLPISSGSPVVSATSDALRGAHVLVVDDNEANRLIVRTYLEAAGGTVEEAGDGAEALELLERSEKPFVLAVLDLRMPRLSGIDVAKRMRSLPKAEDVPVIIVSSDSRPGDAARAREAGIRVLLLKPLRRRELVAAVHDVLLGTPVGVAAVGGAPDTEAATAVPERPLRILLVEDTEDNRLLVLAYLKKLSHTIDIARDGAEAVEAYRAAGPGAYDLVLMDMQMPVMDGYEATRELRRMESEEGYRVTPIVALTAFALAQESQQAIDAGCDGYLTKPIKKATLLDAIARYTGADHE